MRATWRCLILAWQFFTVIPSPEVSHPTEKEMRQSALFLPLVGLVLGGIAAGIHAACAPVLPELANAFITLTIYTLCTGALHVDGLMDTADAIGSRKPRDEALAIMKDSRVGAMGAIAAVFLLAGKWIAIGSFPSIGPTASVALFLVPALSRLAVLWAMALAPAARPNGLGAIFARKVGLIGVGIVSILTWLLAAMLFRPMCGALIFVAFSILVVCFCVAMKRKFGGMTGDTYGALLEITEWILYFLLLSLHPGISWH